jgi:hypothetical protein
VPSHHGGVEEHVGRIGRGRGQHHTEGISGSIWNVIASPPGQAQVGSSQCTRPAPSQHRMRAIGMSSRGRSPGAGSAHQFKRLIRSTSPGAIGLLPAK